MKLKGKDFHATVEHTKYGADLYLNGRLLTASTDAAFIVRMAVAINVGRGK